MRKNFTTNFLRFKLVCRIQLLDSGHHFLHLDVDHGFASRQGSIRQTGRALGSFSRPFPSFSLYTTVFIVSPDLLILCRRDSRMVHFIYGH